MPCALREENRSAAVGELAGINPNRFFFWRRDGRSIQGMRYLHLLCVRKQMIVDPAGENVASMAISVVVEESDPAIQFASRRPPCLLMYLPARILKDS